MSASCNFDRKESSGTGAAYSYWVVFLQSHAGSEVVNSRLGSSQSLSGANGFEAKGNNRLGASLTLSGQILRRGYTGIRTSSQSPTLSTKRKACKTGTAQATLS